MKNRFIKRTLSVVVATVIAATSFTAAVLPAAAFDAPNPDTGAVGAISNGGEWSIYSSKTGKLANKETIEDVTNSAGTAEVTGTVNYSGAFQFDLSTMTTNEAALDKVVKDAKLRITPMVSKSGAKHTVYRINNEFKTTAGRALIAEFTVPRNTMDDFFSEGAVQQLTAEGMTEYPELLTKWQTDIDITGEVIDADDMLSLQIASSSDKTAKVEYATSNIVNNGRLNGNKVPLLYNSGLTDYSKWIYPQIVFTYTDAQNYKDAYEVFTQANTALSAGKVTETEGITLSVPENGSNVSMEMYGSNMQPAIIGSDGRSVVFNTDYVGNDSYATIQLTVTNTDEATQEAASYSRVISIPVEYVRSNTITFDTSKNPKGVVSVTSSGKNYTNGTAYAKVGGEFTVKDNANTGYTAKITVTDASGAVVPQNENGTFTMPDSDVKVSVEYVKKTYGTTRIAATNSISVKSDGSLQGNSASSNLVIGAGRLTFVKFDLTDYNKDVMSEVKLSFNGWNTPNTKAVFFVPNNDWSESKFAKNFYIDGMSDTNISAFKYNDGNNTVSLLNGENRGTLIVPNGSTNDLSDAANGILGAYYLGCSGEGTGDTIDVTEAIKEAMNRSNDGICTLMVYSAGGGRDVNSVFAAGSIESRPSLIITATAANIPDSELVTEINSVEDLEKFAELVSGGKNYADKTVTLKEDIDLSEKYNADGESWQPIGTYDSVAGTQSFDGVFDGTNHTITGLYIDEKGIGQGLFGAVNGDIKDLTVEGTINGSSVIGGISGYSSGKVTNCHSKVNITAEREAGGIVGTLANGGLIENCDNIGNITVKDKETYAGGIAAHSVGAVIKDSYNTGNITNGDNGFLNRIGGLVGYLDDAELKNSYNTGEVKSLAEVSTYVADTAKNYVGGVIGYGQQANVTDCYNTGAVSNMVDYAGGVAGYLHNRDVISKCYNTGNVMGKNYVGGIVGSNDSTVSDCYSIGAVTGTEKVGGSIGYMSSGNVKNCYSTGAVTGTEKVGGVVGDWSSGQVESCYYLTGTAAGANNGVDIANSMNALTSDAFKSKESFDGWDFENVWEMGDNAPVLTGPIPEGFEIKYEDRKAEVTSPVPGEYEVVFAAYKGGKLISIDFQTVKFETYGKLQVNPDELFTTDGATSVKVMLWSKLSEMKPLYPADEKIIE